MKLLSKATVYYNLGLIFLPQVISSIGHDNIVLNYSDY